MKKLNMQNVNEVQSKTNVENEVLFDVMAMLPDEEMINKLSSKYMNSNRNIRGGDAGWIEAAYKDGMRDLVNMLKGN
jgi:hypothetical protein